MSPRTLVLLVALLNLGAGAGVGFALGRATGCRADLPAVPPAEIDIPGLAAALELPPEKDAKVRAILATCRPRCDAVVEGIRPRMRALHEQFLTELSAELTKSQLDKLVAEYHRRAGESAR